MRALCVLVSLLLSALCAVAVLAVGDVDCDGSAACERLLRLYNDLDGRDRDRVLQRLGKEMARSTAQAPATEHLADTQAPVVLKEALGYGLPTWVDDLESRKSDQDCPAASSAPTTSCSQLIFNNLDNAKGRCTSVHSAADTDATTTDGYYQLNPASDGSLTPLSTASKAALWSDSNIAQATRITVEGQQVLDCSMGFVLRKSQKIFGAAGRAHRILKPEDIGGEGEPDQCTVAGGQYLTDPNCALPQSASGVVTDVDANTFDESTANGDKFIATCTCEKWSECFAKNLTTAVPYDGRLPSAQYIEYVAHPDYVRALPPPPALTAACPCVASSTSRSEPMCEFHACADGMSQPQGSQVRAHARHSR